MKKSILFFLIVLLSLQGIRAQEGMQYAFIHYTVTNGLAAHNTSAITQDEQGFIWIKKLKDSPSLSHKFHNEGIKK